MTTDCIITRLYNNKKEILLIKRKFDPFMGKWALPGGFVEIEEDLLDGALRELEEETGLTGIALQQFKTYGSPGRDPRGRTISVVYTGFVKENSVRIQASDDASKANWFQVDDLPALAFDHDKILNDFFAQLKHYPD